MDASFPAPPPLAIRNPQAAIVKAVAQSGLVKNANEVVRVALRQGPAREQENERLAREAAIGCTQLEAGQTVTVESKEHFLALVRGEN